MYSVLYFRPWPLLLRITILGGFIGFWLLINNFHYFFLIRILLFFLITFLWLKDLYVEGEKGAFTQNEIRLAQVGFIFFLASEVILFFSFFWRFFHSRLSASIQIGSMWPPVGIFTIDCWGVPLLNTIVLLSRGATLTWAHFVRGREKRTASLALILTILLRLCFLWLQYEEYVNASFSIRDRVYGSVFFLSTGFHGAHVMLGTAALLVSLLFFTAFNYWPHSIIFLFSVWYWHFVDVVWLFLFLRVYWWGGL